MGKLGRGFTKWGAAGLACLLMCGCQIISEPEWSPPVPTLSSQEESHPPESSVSSASFASEVPEVKEPPVPEIPYEGEWLPSWEWRKERLILNKHDGFDGDGKSTGDNGGPLAGEWFCADFVWLLTHPVEPDKLLEGNWPTYYDQSIYEKYSGSGEETQWIQAVEWCRLTGQENSGEGEFRLLLNVRKISPPDGKFAFTETGFQEWVMRLDSNDLGVCFIGDMVPVQLFQMRRDVSSRLDPEMLNSLHGFLGYFYGPLEFESPQELPLENAILYAMFRVDSARAWSYTREELWAILEEVYGSDFPPVPDMEPDFPRGNIKYNPETGLYMDNIQGSCLPSYFLTPYELEEQNGKMRLVVEIRENASALYEYLLEEADGFWRILSARKLTEASRVRPAWVALKPPETEAAGKWTGNGL